ncbi:TetR/AcrR family transcriptional regulator [Jongsikchunia kroppenstedtii]|uniref:TetR/AcrR family transcriptional regulator n=1 Tax=Jongsikchunia kroppenstedtii TaxID=1121721 RepID=UPI00047593D2|nr:TetR/AcrR family transcriptional regulator [Jongsikchunia kroppenstedtii]
MTKDLGRPRNLSIDGAVLSATVDLLNERGYAELSVDAIARAAGTSKPAIYRRWPSKAHLVHAAVFPIGAATTLPDTGSLATDVRDMLRRTVRFLSTPAARAALPGLVGEMASDPTLHSALLERFGDVLTSGLSGLLAAAAERGEVRPDVTAGDLAEVVAGMALMGVLARGGELDATWIDRNTTLILKGIGTGKGSGT